MDLGAQVNKKVVPKLRIEPIPTSTWGVSLANKWPKEKWNTTRRKVLLKANYKCQGCSSSGTLLHTHEVWDFDADRKKQTLVGFQALCKICHDSSHILRSLKQYGAKYIEEIKDHLCKTNNWTREQLESNITFASQISLERSKNPWKVYVQGKELK